MARQNILITRELRKIKTSFARLARSFSRLAPMLASGVSEQARASAAGGRRPRRRPHLSAAQRSALKLQGKYMGTMRGLKPGQRKKIKDLRARKGIKAAIAAAQRMAG